MQGLESIKFIPLGQRALIIQWPEVIDPKIIAQIWQLRRALAHESIQDSIVAYHSLTLVFWLPQETFTPWIDWIRKNWATKAMGAPANITRQMVQEHQNKPSKKTIEIPVCYDPELAPDLEAFLWAKNLSLKALIKAHTAEEYPLYFYGFQPGFMYLGGLNPELHHPRKSIPSHRVPAGSVAIGGAQTGIYPNEAPGGWHVIGRCPIKLFDPMAPQPILARPEDRIKFRAIDKNECQTILAQSQKASNLKANDPSPAANFGQIEVIKPGLYSSIQDKGRFGFAHLGLPQSGAIDQEAHRLANELLGNPEDCATVEITFGGAAFKFQSASIIALTGANYSPTINQRDISMNEPIKVHSGDVLNFGLRKSGVRTYLGVWGGMHSPKIMGSRSQYKTITPEFSLTKGTLIPIHQPQIKDCSATNPILAIMTMPTPENSPDHSIEIEVSLGPEYHQLNASQRNNLLKDFTIGRNDRMGYLLQEMVSNKLQSMHTSGVLPGTVQLTPGGQIIILMNEGQTTGGYPRIFQLTDKAKALLSQCAQGQKIKFKIL